MKEDHLIQHWFERYISIVFSEILIFLKFIMTGLLSKIMKNKQIHKKNKNKYYKNNFK
jgi:hypothetical protein